MWPKILVTFHNEHCRVASQLGASTILMVMVSGVTLATVGTTLSVLNDNHKVMSIMRMQNRMEFRKSEIESAAAALSSMEKSARKAGSGSALYQCFFKGKCKVNSQSRNFNLYNSGGRKLSGLFDFSGRYCKNQKCPIEVVTKYRIICEQGRRECSNPAEIITAYEIKMRSGQELEGRQLKPIIGEVSLATFVCDKGEFITGVADNGFLKCEKPIPSVFDLTCPDNTAAFGLASDGTFKCISVVDYCNESVYFSYVLDTSGSMSRGKLASASSSGKRIIQGLSKGDMASVTTFNSSSQLRAGASTKVAAVGKSLDGLKARGSTNISDGLKRGGEALSRLSKGAKVIVLLSDGMHNTGTLDPVAVARSFKNKGYRVFSIGFGNDADRTALRQIASSPVDFFAANDANDVKKAFDSINSVICRK